MEMLLVIALAVVFIPGLLWVIRSAEASVQETERQIYEAEQERLHHERLQAERREARTAWEEECARRRKIKREWKAREADRRASAVLEVKEKDGSRTFGTPEYLERVTREAQEALANYRPGGPFSRGAPSSSSDSRQGTVYVIQDLGTGLYKIGRTTNMNRRMRELGVGRSARLVTSKQVRDANAVERAAHQRYRAYRLPQTEYFKLDAPPEI